MDVHATNEYTAVFLFCFVSGYSFPWINIMNNQKTRSPTEECWGSKNVSMCYSDVYMCGVCVDRIRVCYEELSE
jgi:hypothetical protein